MSTIKQIFYAVVLMIFSLIQSCVSNNDDLNKYQNYNVEKNIPYGPGSNDPIRDIRILTKALDLKLLENGYDSIQIRIWFCNNDIKSDMVLLRNTANNWFGFYYSFLVKDLAAKTDIVTGVDLKQVKPKNWTSFIQKLFSNNIKSLPDMWKLKDYNINDNHPGLILVEYADKEIYRLYTYVSPMQASQNLIEARHLTAIVRIICEELNLVKIANWQFGNP